MTDPWHPCHQWLCHDYSTQWKCVILYIKLSLFTLPRGISSQLDPDDTKCKVLGIKIQDEPGGGGAYL